MDKVVLTSDLLTFVSQDAGMFFDHAYDGIVITTALLEGEHPQILYVNPAFCLMTGYPQNELLGKTPRILQGEKTDRAVLSELKMSLQSGKGFEGQTINYKKDGTPYYVEWNILPIVDIEGKTQAYISYKKDITQTVEAELTAMESNAKLQEKQSLLETIMDEDPNLIVVKGSDHTYQFANKALASFYGVKNPHTLIGKKDEDFISNSEQLGLYRQSVNEAFENPEKIFRLVETATDPISGELRYFQSVKKAYKTVDGELSVLVIASDVTSIYKLQEVTYNTQKQLHYVLEATGEGVWDWDIVNHKVEHNARWCEILGLDNTFLEHHDRVYFAMIFEEDQKRVQACIEDAISNKHEYLCEYRMIRTDGELIWVEDHGKIVAYDSENCPIRMVGSIREITERKSAEVLLKKSIHEANVANEAKSNFIANISHEIRTPMSSILGLTQLLLEEEFNTKQKSYLSKIYSASKSLLMILNDILDHARIEVGQTNLVKMPFVVNSLFDALSSLFLPQVEQKGLELFLHVEENIPLSVIGDPSRITKVLSHLLSNAIKFTEKGRIDVTVSGYEETDNRYFLEFRVKDTGIGIDEKMSEDLFAAFTQADSSRTRPFGGTGLGLTLCKSFVERMGGSISFTSRYAEGSTFSFNVLVEKLNEQDSSREFLRYIDMKRVLLVDDEVEALPIFQTYIKGWGLEMDNAVHPFEAMDKIYRAFYTSKPYDSIILNWKMPDMEGSDLVHTIDEVYKQNGHHRAPVTLLLPKNTKEDANAVTKGFELDTVLIKPISQTALFNALKHTIYHEPNEQPIKMSETYMQFKEARVLVAEDSTFNQFMIKEILQRYGIEPVIVNNGQEAVLAVEQSPFDLIFMDIHMPVMNGLEATKKIRLTKNSIELPIVALSALDMNEDRTVCLEAGMNELFSKSLDVHIISHILQRYLVAKSTSDGISSPISHPSFTTPFDVEQVLKRLDMPFEKYYALLENFILRYEDKTYFLRQAFQQQSQDAIFFWLHTLKGIAGNLGFYALNEVCSQLEHKLKLEETLNSELLQAYETILSQTIENIKQLMAQVSSVESNERLKNPFDELLALREALYRKRFIGFETKEKYYKTLVSLIPDSKDCMAIQREIDAFHYTEALTLIQKHFKGF